MAIADATLRQRRVWSRPASPAIARATAVGAFVLGGLAICVLAIMLFGGTYFLTPRLRVVVFFQDSVAGLTVGAPVTLRGVQVGTVQSMKVYIKLPELVPVIPVYMDIEPGRVSWSKSSKEATAADLAVAINAGLRAQLATQSLVTGQVSVNLDFHPDTPAKMVEGDSSVPEIPSIPSDFQHIKDQIADLNLRDLTDKARATLENINAIAGELRGKVGPVADSIRATSDAAQAAVRQVQDDANKTLGSIDQLATTTKEQVVMSADDIRKTLADVRQAAEQANKVLASVNQITAANSPDRTNLDAALRDLAASTSSLRDFTRDLERHPNDLLMGRQSK